MTDFIKQDDGTYVVSVELPLNKDELEQARKQFEDSSNFMRRVKRGTVCGELGSPERRPGMSPGDQFARLMTINHDKVCCRIKNVKVEDDNRVTAVLKPAGHCSDSLVEMIENDTPMKLGMRAYVQRDAGGNQHILEIITFDVVSAV